MQKQDRHPTSGTRWASNFHSFHDGWEALRHDLTFIVIAKDTLGVNGGAHDSTENSIAAPCFCSASARGEAVGKPR
jgi:hypothetical protein